MNLITTVNPTTGDKLQEYAVLTEADIETRLANAHALFDLWSKRPLHARLKILAGVRDRFSVRAGECARLMTLEMGKPITQARAEVKKCIAMFDFVFENAERWLAKRTVSVLPDEAWIEFCASGILLAVMPWNFPFWQVMRFAIPQLAAGNVVVLKHASNSTGVSLLIEELFRTEGDSVSLVQALVIPGAQVASVISDARVRGVTLTGSTAAGRSVAAAAGKALKKHVLELGGSDAYLILEDADVAAAAKLCVQSRLLNTGQSCIAAKRFLVHEKNATEFVREFRAEMETQIIGDPLNENTTMGPIARLDLRDEIVAQIAKSKTQGAALIWGGEVPQITGRSEGAFLLPGFAILKNSENEIFQNEVFGPFAGILPVKSDEEALSIANASVFGLGGAIFCRDLEKAHRFASQMDCGSCFINDFVKSDPRVPFGGVKDSGYGRELTEFGLYEFLNVKTVWLKAGAKSRSG